MKSQYNLIAHVAKQLQGHSRYVLCFTFAVSILSSCITQERCERRFPSKDSTSVRVERHDSVVIVKDTVLIPYQELSFTEESPCPPQVEFKRSVSNNGLRSTVTISGGKITARCEADSLKAVIEKDRHYITTIETRLNEKVKEIRVHFLKWYDHLFRWGFWIMLGLWAAIAIDRFVLKK